MKPKEARVYANYDQELWENIASMMPCIEPFSGPAICQLPSKVNQGISPIAVDPHLTRSLKISDSKPSWKTHCPNVESVPERVVRAYRSCGKNLGWSQLQTANTKYENTRKVQKYTFGGLF